MPIEKSIGAGTNRRKRRNTALAMTLNETKAITDRIARRINVGPQCAYGLR